MRIHRVILIGICCLCFVLGTTSLFGQATGSLSGTVQDRTGAMLPGASVTATSQGTSAARAAKTDDSGHFLIPLLPTGVYTLRVDSAGFQSVEQKDITLQVDESRELNFSMSLATVQQTVEVSSTAVAVETSNASLGQVITAQQVAELPLNGRNFVQLATLTPGTIQETNPNSFFNGGGSSEVSIRGSFSLSVGGSRPNSTDWLLDGVDNNELTAGGIAIVPDIDALQEFKVLTYNYSAEYGTRSGPTVLLTTKSGTNQIHGSLFEFLRRTGLDARSFFAKDREVFNQHQFGGSVGGPVQRDKTFLFFDYQGKHTRQGKVFVGQVPTLAMRNGNFSETFKDVNQGGPPSQLTNPFAVGGFPGGPPFQCVPGTKTPEPVVNGVQPSGQDCNVIPPGLFNPIGQALVNLYPAPNNLGPNFLSQDYLSTPVKQYKEGEADLRLDHNFSSADSLYARFSYDQATEYLPGGSPGFAEANAFSSTQSLTNHGRNAALGETHIFSPSTLNKLTLGYNRIFNNILSFGSGSCAAQKLGIPGANLGGVSCGLTSTLVTSGFWALGDRGFAPFQGGTNIFHIADSFDMIRGGHDMTFGGEFRANQMNVLTNAFQDGFYVFAPVFTGQPIADLLLGLPVFGQHDQTFQGTVTGRRWKIYRPFFQDNWRATPNLTLNLGLAWAIVTPVTEAHNRQSNFDFRTGQFLIGGKNGGSTVGLSTDTTTLEPRIGIAWSPGGDRKTSLRAGFAIYHDSSWNQGGQGLWENPPYFGSSFVPFGNTISQGFPILTQATDPAKFGGNLQTQNLNFKQGRVMQYNFNIERQIPGEVLLTVGYAGARSTHILEGGQNINVKSPSACGFISGYTYGCGQPNVPYPQFGNINDIFDNGSATYNSLQVKAETKSGKHGLYALVGYTYSKSVDNGLSDGLGSNIGAMYFPLPNIGTGDKALSQIDLTHNFTASLVYQLPFGKGKQFGNSWNGLTNAILGNWEVDAIEHAISGFPLLVVSSAGGSNAGVGFSNNGNNFVRPDRVCNGRLSNWNVNQYFNTSCFVDPIAKTVTVNGQPVTYGALGNSNRAPLFGPGLVNTDFSAVKNFPVAFREGMSLQFRAEFFNLWNHPQFLAPGGGVTDIDGVGPAVITATVNNPRLIQFALKLRF